MKKTLLSCLVLLSSLGVAAQYSHTVQAEKLDRGVVAVKTNGGVFVSWRSLVSDDKNLAFDVYRDNVKITETPLRSKTNLTDAQGTASSKYTVKAVLNDAVTETSAEASVWETPYLKVHLDRPAGGTIEGNSSHIEYNKDGSVKAQPTDDYTYTPDDVAAADVDGDGQWELIVKWFPTNAADNSFRWFTSPTIIDCYKLDGTKLWRINLGKNIRSGNHYTQFLVYDFDGNGKAELICKTAPGTVDGQGKNVIMGSDDPNANYVNSRGIIISGPEYLTVFNGETGAEINTIAYNPPRTIQEMSKSGWGDDYGNRCERYLAGVAYLDGKTPSAIFCRGYYTHAYVWAVNFDGAKLSEKWLHKSEKRGSKSLYGQGTHSLTVGDVDGDGFDEIVYGSALLDHDGTCAYSTGKGHGDALHLADMLPDREGLEVFMPHEESPYGVSLRDAKTGEILFSESHTGDTGRGLAANISLKHRGYEWWSSTNTVGSGTEVVTNAKRPAINFRVYWDGDLLDEVLDKTEITKPNDDLTSISRLIKFNSYSNASSCNGTKGTPNLQADLFGDWREEVILHDGNTQSDLLIFTTTIPSDYKVPTLMQERQYRVAAAWQNCAYNQPPHLGYNLEEAFNTRGAITITSGSTNQIIYAGDEIQPISFKVLRAKGIEEIKLPEGLTYTFDPATLTGTISGSMAQVGEYAFTITTTGAADDYNATTECHINVRQNTSLELLAYFPFETVGATTRNYIKGEATAYNGAESTAVEGKNGNAISLNGTQAYSQDTYDLIDFGTSSFTIELWMKSSNPDANCYLLNKGVISPDNGSGNWVGIEYKDNKGVKELRFAVDDNVTKSEIKALDAEKYFDGEWHHIVAARDAVAKALFLYVDGVLVKQGADNSGAIVTNEPLTIGNVNFSYDNGFNGMLDELSIYRGVMSATKVTEHYTSTGNEYAAYFPMDDISDSTPNKTYGSAVSNTGSAYSTTGLKGGAISFDNSYYLTQTIYDAINFGEKDFSIELWARSTDDDGYLFCIGTHNTGNVTGGTGNWIGLERTGDLVRFTIDDNVNKTDCTLSDASGVFDGEWHHITCVRKYAEKVTILYVDGFEVARSTNVSTGAINFSASELFFIGGDDEPTEGKENRTFAGDIDELFVYSKALTPEEVEEHYNLLRLSEIEDILSESATARYTVVDALSGRVIRTAVGEDRTDIIDSLPQGIYLLVVENGQSLQTYKFVKR